MNDIHPTALVAQGAILGQNVIIGAYCVVGGDVVLGDNVHLVSHVCVSGITSIGADTIIHPFSSIGSIPQDLKYKGEAGRLDIGQRNKIREHVTINIGTEGGGLVTKIGDDNLLMVGVHVGHDCLVGNHVILVNNATLAGHVSIEDYAVLGGLSAVHQFCRIGKMAMIGGMTGIEHDVIPYGMVMGNRGKLKGLNLIGIERSGCDKITLNGVRAAYKMLFDTEAGHFDDRLEDVSKQYCDNILVKDIVHFLKSPSKRRFTMV